MTPAKKPPTGARSKRQRFEVGDVFSIPIDDTRIGYGQIVASWGRSGGHFYFAVFDAIYPRDEAPDLKTVLAAPLVLLALSMDALLAHGHWKVVGHCDVDSEAIPWPAYKESVSPGVVEVVDYTGKVRRPATRAEAACLLSRTVVAPIIVEDALKALHGLKDWDQAYDKLRVSPDGKASASLLPQ